MSFRITMNPFWVAPRITFLVMSARVKSKEDEKTTTLAGADFSAIHFSSSASASRDEVQSVDNPIKADK